MKGRSEQTVAYRVYHNGSDLLGVATIEAPQIQFLTETLAGSGIAGEIENPTIGMSQSLAVKFTFNSPMPAQFDTIDWNKAALYECYGALQVSDDATGMRDSVPVRMNILGRPKSFPLGTWEQGKKHGNEVEMEVTRLEYLLDGEEKLLIDKLNFIYRVNGSDLMQKIRQQTGMNI